MTDKSKIVSLTAGSRPEPPAELDAEAAAEWTRIVGSQPADRFSPLVWPLLTQFCRHVVTARFVDTLSAKAAAADLTDERAFDEYETVRKMACRETRALTRLAKALRLGRRAAT